MERQVTVHLSEAQARYLLARLADDGDTAIERAISDELRALHPATPLAGQLRLDAQVTP